MARPLADRHRRAVIAEWDAWESKHVPSGTVATSVDAAKFYDYLQRDRSDLLEFPSDDKWERVHKWLLRVYRVRESDLHQTPEPEPEPKPEPETHQAASHESSLEDSNWIEQSLHGRCKASTKTGRPCFRGARIGDLCWHHAQVNSEHRR